MIGMLCALIAGTIWLLVATYFSMPVSTTHTTVGSIIGFAVVANGFDSLNWSVVSDIMLSWVLSPVISGVLAACIFVVVRKFVLEHNDSIRRACIFYPLLVGFTIAVNVFFIIYKGLPGVDDGAIAWWVAFLACIGGFLVSAAITQFFVVPFVRRRLEAAGDVPANPREANILIELGESESLPPAEGSDSVPEPNIVGDIPNEVSAPEEPEKKKKQYLWNQNLHEKAFEDDDWTKEMWANSKDYDPKTELMFSYLQVFTATMDSFAHGANDVANGIGPFAAIYALYTNGSISSKSTVPAWILALGGLGIILGVLLYGYKIIVALGIKLTKMSASRGFAVEITTALTVVSASFMGIPVSTTQCQVGATTGLGLADGGRKTVHWPILLKAILGWVLTIIISATISGAIYAFCVYSPSESAPRLVS
jgi:sodium-dependent phosphate transporter